MNRQYHYLKTETKYFQAYERGDKTFEVRKNDRNFKIGDMVCLQETINGVRTGREAEPKEVKYIFQGGQHGVAFDYIVMQLGR